MSNQVAKSFREGIAAAAAKLGQVSDAAANARIRSDGWTAKEETGHLIDSALNNLQRFVRGTLDGHYEGPTYAQNGWVELNGYGQQSWAAVLSQWQKQNDVLCEVVERIPEERLGAVCKVGANEPVTLRFLIEDYLVHLHHHVDQIAGRSAGGTFLSYSAAKMQQMGNQIRECVKQLSEEQIWQRSGEHCNSVGNLVLHLCGNIRQWVGHGVGGQADIREREREFSARGGRSSNEILELFDETVGKAIAIVTALPQERLTERTTPQNREVSVLEAIYQVVGHMQLHGGQIIFATKQMTGKDLEFYKP